MQKLTQLQDFISEDTEFKLSNGTVIELRAADMEDFGWITNKFGPASKAPLNEIESVSQIVYRLMKDKSKFPPTEMDGHDDDGNPVKIKKTGPQMFAKAMRGMSDFWLVVQAMNKAMGTDAEKIKQEPQAGADGAPVEEQKKSQ
jgi:hypothetical protein